jgi:hypothetical protein
MDRYSDGRFAPGYSNEYPQGLVPRNVDSDSHPDDGRTCTRCDSESKEFDEHGVCYWCVSADRDNDGDDTDENDWQDDTDDETDPVL